MLLQKMGIISLPGGNKDNPLLLIVILFGLCIMLGTALTAFFSRKALNPIRKVIDATHRVANGDFNVKIDLKGIGELEDLSHSFNKMTQELSTIETLRSDFINNFSHEFKTPIVSVRGFAKLLKENKLSEEERREYLDIIITESERLAALSTNVLTLSKYENLEIIVDKTPFRLDEQLRRTIVLMEPKWSAKEITVNVELDEVIYIGSEDLTQQIWLNLLDNAIKFSYQGGLINITLVNVNDEIRFVIQDDGPGMDEQSKARIFDKFYQGDTSHSKTGYGLGLPLVKRIVKLCGGDVIVQSEIGKGSMFTIVLPSLT
ncbi:HAMP domain-containing sensor histidine kinase [Paenibacillus konkukensis]|nr:HAMP domain-containing sensor histidine kinase [Paenibacillus konkukensis]